MDPKGDRLRKIKMGQLKLPDSVLQSNNISLTADPPKVGGGCLEGGPRPRPVVATKAELRNTVPIIIPSSNSNLKKGASSSVMIPPNMADIPLPSNADIPLPKDMDIPLPPNDIIPLPAGDPMPKHEDIPLPSDASIPLPADKPPQQERRKIRVHLEPNGDELLCRSCQMRFAKQIEYDTHLQSEEHQQVF